MNVVHENETYVVEMIDDSEKNYSVVNKDTLCVEYEHNALPQVIGVAEQFNHLLINEMWRGVAEQPVSDNVYPLGH